MVGKSEWTQMSQMLYPPDPIQWGITGTARVKGACFERSFDVHNWENTGKLAIFW